MPETTKNQAVYQVIFDAAPDTILVVDHTGTIVMANNRVTSVFGYELDEVIGKNVEMFLPDRVEDLHHKKRTEYQQNPHVKKMGGDVPLQGKRKDGSEIYIETSLSPVKVEGEMMVAAIVRDVSSKHELTHKLTNTLNELKVKNKEMEMFAYNAAHDLKQPVKNISSLIYLLETESSEELNEQAKIFLGHMKSSSNRMLNLIESLLEYSRIGRMSQVAEIDLNQVLEDIKVDFTNEIELIKAEIHYDPMPTITGNESSIRRLFQNIIANAIKFRKNRRPLSIRIAASSESGFWKFSIEDNGIGIPSNQLENIFEIFHRLHSKDSYEGSGIGLAQCKKIVESHHGTLWVESEHGSGSTFYFNIPNHSR